MKTLRGNHAGAAFSVATHVPGDSDVEEVSEPVPAEQEPVPDTRLGMYTFDGLVVGFLRAFARGCREGLPARIINGPVTSVDPNPLSPRLMVNTVANRRELLSADLKFWQNEERVATRELKACQNDQDWRVEKYRAEENAAHIQVERILRDLADLPQVEQVRDAPTRVVTFGDILDAALRNILTCEDRVSQQKFQALQTVVVNFRMDPNPAGVVEASADVLLPIPGGGLGLFGPVRWPAGAGGKGPLAIRARQAAFAPDDIRDEVLELLHAYPQVGREPALALVTTPFAELAHVVMHGLNGRPFPDWVGQEWREQPFVDWITTVYTTGFPTWASQGRYTMVSRERILLVQFAAQTGSFTEDDLLELIDCPAPVFLDWCAIDKSMGPGTKPWFSPVEKAYGRRGSVSYTNVLCDYGHRATLVAHVPEVPRDLLCPECMTMPERENFGMPVDVRFPVAYREVLHIDLRECLEELRLRWSEKTWVDSEFRTQLLDALAQFPDGSTAPVLARILGVRQQNIQTDLRRLRWRQQVEMLPGFPAVWVLPHADLTERQRELPSISRARGTNPADADPGLAPAGPFLDPVELLTLTGWHERNARRNRSANRVFAVRIGHRHYYPRWQFTDEGRVADGLIPLFNVLAGVDRRKGVRWLVTGHPDLEGLEPREVATSGDDQRRLLDVAALDASTILR